ncbi:hypothetical protein K2634_002294 [Salmonella enterica subsp. enterica serovar Chester]|nr:hypothetical protein [Salmonella enterica subsp. enterica serovar Chester]
MRKIISKPGHVKILKELMDRCYNQTWPLPSLTIESSLQRELFGYTMGCCVLSEYDEIIAPVDVCTYDEEIEGYQFTAYTNSGLNYRKLVVREKSSNRKIMFKVFPSGKVSNLCFQLEQVPFHGAAILTKPELALLSGLIGFEAKTIKVEQELTQNDFGSSWYESFFRYEMLSDKAIKLTYRSTDDIVYHILVSGEPHLIIEDKGENQMSALRDELAQFIRDVEEKSKSDHIFSQRYPELIDETTDSVVDGIRIFPSGLAIYRVPSLNQLKVMEMLKDVLAEAGWEYRFDCNFEGMALFVTKKNYTLSIDLPKSQYYSFFPKADDRTEKEPAMLLDAAESNTLMMRLRMVDKKLNTGHLTTIGKDYGWKSVEPYGSQLLFVADL